MESKHLEDAITVLPENFDCHTASQCNVTFFTNKHLFCNLILSEKIMLVVLASNFFLLI